MPDTWEDEMCIDTGTPPIYLTRAERYMLFRIAEQEQVPERTMLRMIIEREYSRRSSIMRNEDE